MVRRHANTDTRFSIDNRPLLPRAARRVGAQRDRAYRAVTCADALLAGDGAADSHIASTLGISRPTVLKWRARFLADGLDSVGEVRTGLRSETQDHYGSGEGHRACHAARDSAGRDTRWSCRSMAKAAGVGHATVQRIWDAQACSRTG